MITCNKFIAMIKCSSNTTTIRKSDTVFVFADMSLIPDKSINGIVCGRR